MIFSADESAEENDAWSEIFFPNLALTSAKCALVPPINTVRRRYISNNNGQTSGVTCSYWQATPPSMLISNTCRVALWSGYGNIFISNNITCHVSWTGRPTLLDPFFHDGVLFCTLPTQLGKLNALPFFSVKTIVWREVYRPRSVKRLDVLTFHCIPWMGYCQLALGQFFRECSLMLKAIVFPDFSQTWSTHPIFSCSTYPQLT